MCASRKVGFVQRRLQKTYGSELEAPRCHRVDSGRWFVPRMLAAAAPTDPNTGPLIAKVPIASTDWSLAEYGGTAADNQKMKLYMFVGRYGPKLEGVFPGKPIHVAAPQKVRP